MCGRWDGYVRESPIYCGIAQGSVFGPALFCMYTMSLEDVIFPS